MLMALDEAKKSMMADEVPVGALIVIEDKIISTGHNSSIKRTDPTAHAEINVIREAAIKTNNYRLTGSTLFVTLEPCIMCFGAIIQARVENLVFGAYDSKAGLGKYLDSIKDSRINHKPKIIGGILEKECSDVLVDFFKKKRD